MSTTADRVIDYRANLPERMARLPQDAHGRPVPWFVEWVNGKPDFRIIDGRKLPLALSQHRCWVCGDTMGGYKAFVIGPMCLINRISAEPPSHKDCAIYSATHCDFLTNPERGRRERFLPAGVVDPPGGFIKRNPGVMLVYVTKSFRLRPIDDSALMVLDDPTEALWYAEGRPATRDEVMIAIETGFPQLQEMAEKEGPAAVVRLAEMRVRAQAYLP